MQKKTAERAKIRQEGEVRENFNEIKKLVDECHRKMQECRNTGTPRRYIQQSL